MFEKLKEIGLDQAQAQIYVELLEASGSTAGALAKKVPMARATLYDNLQKMVDAGLVNRTLRKGVRYFQAENPQKILQSLKTEKSKLEKKCNDFEDIIPQLMSLQNSANKNPKIKIFEGREAVKKILDDMLTYQDIETCSYWPINSMIKQLSAEFFYHHNKMRIKRNLYTRAIWPISEVIDMKEHPYLGTGDGFRREIRIAPESIQFVMGYWMYANKIAFVSSKRENYGFIIESAEMVEMIKSQFEVLWQISTPITKYKAIPDETTKFLMEIEKEK